MSWHVASGNVKLGNPQAMRLLVLTWNYPPTVGGIEQVAFHMTEGLRGLGHDVPVIAAAGGPDGARMPDPESKVYRAGRQGIPAFLLHAFVKGLSLVRRDRTDFILCPSLTSAPAAWLISRLTGVPYAVLIHGSDVVIARTLYQLFLPILLRGARLLFANSNNTAALIETKGINPERIRVVCPGVTPPPPPASQPTTAISELMMRLEGRPVLLTVGRLVKRKGILEFVSACMPQLAKEFPQVVYLVVGGDPKHSLIHHERITDQLENAIANLQLGDNVILLGRLSDADLDLVYRRTSLFVLPCINDPHDVEGFGIVLLEAALQAVPSVATRCGGIPDAVVHGVTGQLVDAGNYAALSDTIAHLLRNPGEVASLGQKAKERTLSEFTWAAVASRYEAGLESSLRPDI